MAYGKVQETFWDDPTLRGISHGGRFFMLYLLTNRHKNRLGLYVLPPAYAAEDLQWTMEQVAKYRDELVDAGRIDYDEEHRCVLIKNFLRHNTLENQKVVKGAIAELSGLPDTPLLVSLLNGLRENARAHYTDVITTLSNRIGNRFPNGIEGVSPPNPNPSLIPSPSQDAPKAARMRPDELVGFWLDRMPVRPPQKQIGKQGAVAKRLCEQYTREEIAQAAIGLTLLYPHAPPKREAWDLFDLERKFAKALNQAMHHPDVKGVPEIDGLEDADLSEVA